MSFLNILLQYLSRAKGMGEIIRWRVRDSPPPPPHSYKQHVLRSYARKFNLSILVESGTYLGDMVWAMKDSFDQIISIELSGELHEKAKNKFANYPNITLVKGDSGVEIGKIVTQIQKPALFWLDGHYSSGETACGAKETPILEELEHILPLMDSGHVVIIDDARCFGTQPSYPAIDELEKFVLKRCNNVKIYLKDDSIRIEPHI